MTTSARFATAGPLGRWIAPPQIREQEDLTADAARWRALPRSEREERQTAMRQNCAPVDRALPAAAVDRPVVSGQFVPVEVGNAACQRSCLSPGETRPATACHSVLVCAMQAPVPDSPSAAHVQRKRCGATCSWARCTSA